MLRKACEYGTQQKIESYRKRQALKIKSKEHYGMLIL